MEIQSVVKKARARIFLGSLGVVVVVVGFMATG